MSPKVGGASQDQSKITTLEQDPNHSLRNAPFPKSAIFAELVSTSLIPAMIYEREECINAFVLAPTDMLTLIVRKGGENVC